MVALHELEPPDLQDLILGHPGGIRNRVGWMKTSYPRPLDDGAIYRILAPPPRFELRTNG